MTTTAQMKDHKKWEPCPRCGSKRVKKLRQPWYFILGIIALSLGIWFWRFIVFSRLTIIGGIGALLAGIGDLFFPSILRCKDCNEIWKSKKL